MPLYATKKFSCFKALLLLAGVNLIVLIYFYNSFTAEIDADTLRGLKRRQTRSALGIPITRPADASFRSKATRVAVLLKWFQENGGFINPNLEIRQRDGHSFWGVFATGNIAAKEDLVAVPTHLTLTPRTALSMLVSELREKCTDSDPSEQVAAPRDILEALGFASDHDSLNQLESPINRRDRMDALLALYLVVHMDNVDNFFYPFFATLPRGCQNIICWSDHRLESTFREYLWKHWKKDRNVFKGIARRLGLDETDFLEKVSLVQTRSWNDATNKARVFIPIMDMFNHPEGKKTGAKAILNLELNMKGAHLPQPVDVGKGEELWIKYGNELNSAMLLRTYGYHYPFNPHDNCKELRLSFTDEYLANSIVLPQGLRCGKTDKFD